MVLGNPMRKALAAAIFAELGHERRLSIVLKLVKAAPGGLSMGELGRLTKIPNSTLSHHINKLIAVKLISRKQDKQTLTCFVNLNQINVLSTFLLEKCCLNTSKTEC